MKEPIDSNGESACLPRTFLEATAEDTGTNLSHCRLAGLQMDAHSILQYTHDPAVSFAATQPKEAVCKLN
jgi:hypothetical protein